MFTHSGAIRVERQYGFLPQLQQENGLLAAADEEAPCDRSELSFATTPASFIPHLYDEAFLPSDNDRQIANSDLLQLAADGFVVHP